MNNKILPYIRKHPLLSQLLRGVVWLSLLATPVYLLSFLLSAVAIVNLKGFYVFLVMATTMICAPFVLALCLFWLAVGLNILMRRYSESLVGFFIGLLILSGACGLYVGIVADNLFQYHRGEYWLFYTPMTLFFVYYVLALVIGRFAKKPMWH